MEETLGKRIVRCRKGLGLTQDALAEKLGVTAQAVSKWENDQSCPDITMLPKLAEIFGITIDMLLGVAPIREKTAPAEPELAVEFQDDGDEKGHWELHWNSSRRTALGFAVWLLIAGLAGIQAVGRGIGLWGILWSSGLLAFGLFGLYPKFSLFRLGCASDKCIDEKISMKQLIIDANPLKAFFEGKYFMTAAFVMLFVINALINLGNTGFDQAFNYYLKDQLNLTSAYNGIIKAVVGLVSFAANMSLCLWIIRKTNVKKSMVVLLLGCTAVSVATVLPLSLRLFMVFGVLVYTGYSVIVPVLQDMVASLAAPEQKNLVMGFFNATRSIGSIIGALAAGFIYGIHAKLPFLCVALSYGLSILVAVLFLIRRRKQ